MTYPMLQCWVILLCFVSLSIASAAHGVSSVGMVRDMAKLSSEVHMVDDLPTTCTSRSGGSCADDRTTHDPATRRTDLSKAVVSLRGGGGSIFPAGWNPMGYKITPQGERFLSMGDSLSCDVGRFLASLKSNRKRRSILKDSWLEIVRASKTGQAMRIYRTIDDLLDFCLQAGLVD
jgi:hypothetical protein